MISILIHRLLLDIWYIYIWFIGWTPSLIGWLTDDTWGPLGSGFHAEAPGLDHLHLQTPVPLCQPNLHVSCSKTNTPLQFISMAKTNAPPQYISPEIKQTPLNSIYPLSYTNAPPLYISPELNKPLHHLEQNSKTELYTSAKQTPRLRCIWFCSLAYIVVLCDLTNPSRT